MIKAEDKIADVIKRYPFIKEKLIEKNAKFKNLDNTVLFNTIGRFARMSDMAKVSGEKLEELLDFINELIVNNK